MVSKVGPPFVLVSCGPRSEDLTSFDAFVLVRSGHLDWFVRGTSAPSYLLPIERLLPSLFRSAAALLSIIENHESRGNIDASFASAAKTSTALPHDGDQIGKVLLRVFGVGV